MTYEEAFSLLDTDPPNPSPLSIWDLPDLVEDIFQKIVSLPGEVATWVWEKTPWWVRYPLESLRTFFLRMGWGFWEFIRDPLEALSDLASWVWERIPDWLISAFRFLEHLSTRLWYNITDFFTDAVGYLSDLANRVWEWMPDWVRAGLRFWWEAAAWPWSRLFDFVRDPWAAFRDPLEFLFGDLLKALTAVFHEMIIPVRRFLDRIWDGLTRWFTDLGADIRQGFTRISGDIQMLPATMKGLWDLSVQEILAGMFEPITSAFDWLVGQFQRFAGAIAGWFTGPFIETFKGLGQWFADRLQESFEWLVERLLAIIRQFTPITPDRGLNVATAGMTLALVGAGGLGAMTLAGQLARWWSNLGAGPIAAMFADVANYRAITGAVMGTIAATFFATPLKYYLNALARPWLPDFSSVHEALGRGKILAEVFRSQLA